MTNQEITYAILNYEMTDSLLKECLEEDFRKTIIGIKNAIYELTIRYHQNKETIDELIKTLESIAKTKLDMKELKIFHGEIKSLNSSLHRDLDSEKNPHIFLITKELQNINRILKQTMNLEEAAEKIKVIEKIIYENKNLKVITALIKDNKGILKIKDAASENILYKLLKKYSTLPESSKEEINYLYQVIALFLNNDDVNIEIIRDPDYYLQALDNTRTSHVEQIRPQIESSKHQISLSELENKYQVYTKYHREIEKELYTFTFSHNGALDFRSQNSVTIDGAEAVCLDDAVCIEQNQDGSYTLYVHITYIPALIPYESAINKESIKKMETKYLIDCVDTLYPEYVSNYLASLLPHNIRHTQTGIWLIEPDMTLVEDSFKLVKSNIISHHRLTYEEADQIIGNNGSYPLSKMLVTLGEFALKQRKRNNTKELYREIENSLSNNPNNESRLVNHLISANIVQECSLLFGRSKAELYKKQGFSYNFRACGEQQNFDLNGKELKNICTKSQNQISNTIAYYTHEPKKHHGLGYDAYSHSGSPARRSPDGQNQYIDEELIFAKNINDKTVYKWEERTKKLTQHYNITSQRIEAFSNQYNYLASKKLIKKP